MSHLSRELTTELFKYRRRRGSLPHSPSSAGSQDSLGSSGQYGGSMFPMPSQPEYHHDLYMRAVPRAYQPSLHAPAVQATEYEPYDAETFFPGPQIHPHRDPKSEIREIPGGIVVPSDDLTMIDRLLRAMAGSDVGLGGAEHRTAEDVGLGPPGEQTGHPSMRDLVDAFLQLSQVFPPDHRDLTNLRAAIRERLDAPNAGPNGDGLEQSLAWGPEGAGMISEQSFYQPIDEAAMLQAAEKMLGYRADAAVDATTDPIQQGPPQGLEALVQEAMLQQNPNEPQHDFLAQEQMMMYEEEMKQLLDPFAMPGFGPG